MFVLTIGLISWLSKLQTILVPYNYYKSRIYEIYTLKHIMKLFERLREELVYKKQNIFVYFAVKVSCTLQGINPFIIEQIKHISVNLFEK